MFQDEDEEDAKRQYEERLEILIKTDERMKTSKADKDERVRKQIEAKIKEENERKEKDEEQKKQKRQWMEDQHREAVKRQKEQEIDRLEKEQPQKVKAIELQLEEEKARNAELERMWNE